MPISIAGFCPSWNSRASLVVDRIDCDRGLAGSAIADDQLALAAAQCEQRIDRQDAGLDRLADQFSFDDRRCWRIDRVARRSFDRQTSIQRSSQWIDDAPEKRGPDRRSDHLSGAAHQIAGLDRLCLIEQNAADQVAVERLYEPQLTTVEAQHFVKLGGGQAGDYRDAVARCLHATQFLDRRTQRRPGDPVGRVFKLRRAARHSDSAPAQSGRGPRAS